MDVSKVISSNINSLKPEPSQSSIGSFKALLAEKKEALKNTSLEPEPSSPHASKDAVTNAVNEIINTHELATNSVKTFLTRTDYTPEKLLAMQYKTSVLFLREQLFSKTAELSANTVRNFTQMQV